ncbi:hypothetical protein [Rhodococcus sp. FH8]|uniref:hypothetical protein n=1 Tax=Rhodococcus sp. FH8 TaxID=1761013 RepID=UPI001C4FC27E|nr:hypothetical protein [Rhodococcus sp. FH8]
MTDITFNRAKGLLFVAAIMMVIIGIIWSVVYNRSQKDLQGINSTLDDELSKMTADRDNHVDTINGMVITISDMYASLLRRLAENCSITEPHRLSLYDSADSNYFKLYSRYASDPERSGLTADELTKPKGKGCLGLAWAEGKCSRIFSEHKSTYKREHRDLGYLDDEINGFTMRPRVVFGIRFPQGSQNTYGGVLVVELQNKVTQVQLDTLIEQVEKSATWGNIASAYKSLPTAIDRSTSPSERGF